MASELEQLSLLTDWVFGGLAAVIGVMVIQNIAQSYRAKSQKRILTTIAIGNGIVIGLGIAPMSTLAAEFVPFTSLFTSEYIGFISKLVTVGTVLEMLFGAGKMHEGSGWGGVFAFALAFLGGVFLPYRQIAMIGVLLVGFGFFWMEAKPANQWRRGRF